MDRFDRWIFDSFPVTPEGLGIYRIGYALFTLLVVAPGHGAYTRFADLGTLPEGFFLPPPGPMMLVPGLPGPLFFQGVVLLLNLCLVALLLGYRTRLASVLTTVLFLVGFGFSYSFGKINHTLLFALVPLIMAASNWGAAYSVDALRRQNPAPVVAGWPITLLALLLGFGMFTAGFTKLIGGWLDPSTQAAQGHFIRQFYTLGRQDFLAPVFTRITSPVFWESLDWATVCFEMGFLAAVLHPRTTRLFAALAVGFHNATLLMLNISFAVNLPVYAAFLDGTRWRLPVPFPPERLARGWALGGSLLAGTAFFTWIGSPLSWLDGLVSFSSDLTMAEVVAQLTALGLVLALGAQAWRRRRVSRHPLPDGTSVPSSDG